jgi:hypothetical protein
MGERGRGDMRETCTVWKNESNTISNTSPTHKSHIGVLSTHAAMRKSHWTKRKEKKEKSGHRDKYMSRENGVVFTYFRPPHTL